MAISFIDHILLISKDLNETETFMNVILGEPAFKNEEYLLYKIGETSFLYRLAKTFEPGSKDTHGLNHIAFGVSSVDELKAFESRLNEAGIKNSGIGIDSVGKGDYIWLDGPNGERIEIYHRPQ